MTAVDDITGLRQQRETIVSEHIAVENDTRFGSTNNRKADPGRSA